MGAGAPESSVGAKKGARFPLKNLTNWSDLAGDKGGGMGGGVGRWPIGGRARGEMGGGAPESSVGATKWGGGPWRAGKGGDGGGHQRAVWEQQKVLVPLFGSLKNLTIGLIWLVMRVGGWGEAWGGGPRRAGKGGDGGGGQKAVWAATKDAFFGLP